MNRIVFAPVALSLALGISSLSAAPSQDPASHIPPSIAAKKESPEIVAALKPLRDQLAADRQALKAAMTAGNQAGIASGKAAIQSDYKAIRAKRMELIKAGTK